MKRLCCLKKYKNLKPKLNIKELLSQSTLFLSSRVQIQKYSHLSNSFSYVKKPRFKASLRYSNFIPNVKSISKGAKRWSRTKPININIPDSFPVVWDSRIHSISAGNSVLKMHKNSQSLNQCISSLTQNFQRVGGILNEIGGKYLRIPPTRKKNFYRWANFFWGVRPIFVWSKCECWVGSRVEKRY